MEVAAVTRKNFSPGLKLELLTSCHFSTSTLSDTCSISNSKLRVVPARVVYARL